MQQKERIAINILLIFITSLSYSQNNMIEQNSNLLINSIFENRNPNILLNKEVLQVHWEDYLDLEYLNKNNSETGKFFIPLKLELSIDDLNYMKEQAQNQKIKKWDKKKVRSIKLIRANKRINYVEKSRYRISQPLFNRAMNYAIIIEEYIGGIDNSSSFLKIFKYNGNCWNEIAFIELWIS